MPDLTSSTVSTSVLKAEIQLEDGSKLTINVPDPLDNLTKNDVELSTSQKGFAGYIVSENLINKGGYAAVGVGEVYYYNTEKIIFD